jgi:hypothetical protein
MVTPWRSCSRISPAQTGHLRKVMTVSPQSLAEKDATDITRLPQRARGARPLIVMWVEEATVQGSLWSLSIPTASGTPATILPRKHRQPIDGAGCAMMACPPNNREDGMAWRIGVWGAAVLLACLAPALAADQNSAAPQPRKREACFFEDRDFYGTAKCFQLEDGKSNRVIKAFEDRFDRRVSSLRLGDGVIVELCNARDMEGTCTAYDSLTDNLEKSWNDRTRSAVIWDANAKNRPRICGDYQAGDSCGKPAKDQTPGYAFDKEGFIIETEGNAGAPYVCLYAGSSYTGEELCLWQEGWTDLRKKDFLKAESVRVQRGYQVTLCPGQKSPMAECEKGIDAPSEEISEELLGKVRAAFVEER